MACQKMNMRGAGMQKILLLEIPELRYLELTCPKCGKGYVFDLDPAKTLTLREQCPLCNADWKPPRELRADDPFVVFRRFCDALAGFQANFRIAAKQKGD